MPHRVVDIHAHMLVPAVEALVADRPERREELRQQAAATGAESVAHNRMLFAAEYLPKLTDVDVRLAAMDAMGVDVQALSVSPTQYYYWADQDLARAIVAAANEHLASVFAAHPDRFVGLATVSLQHPALAADQLTHAVVVGHAVRPESRRMRERPSAYLERIWFDSLVYTPEALEHLVRTVGAHRIVIGTDYPFDMGMYDPLDQIARANLSETDRDLIRGANAWAMLNMLDAGPVSSGGAETTL